MCHVVILHIKLLLLKLLGSWMSLKKFFKLKKHMVSLSKLFPASVEGCLISPPALYLHTGKRIYVCECLKYKSTTKLILAFVSSFMFYSPYVFANEKDRYQWQKKKELVLRNHRSALAY